MAGPDTRDAKTFHIVRTLGQARDVLIAPDRIVVRVPGDRAHHAYHPHDGPSVLTRILRDTGVPRLDRPTVAHAAAGMTWRLIETPSADEVAWLLPWERGVEVRFRPPPREGPPRVPIEIPADGPWALPAPWSPPAPPAVLEVDGMGVACPHCARTSARYRAFEGAFICRACGRSFTSAALAGRLRGE